MVQCAAEARRGLVVAAHEVLQHLELRSRHAEGLELGVEAGSKRAAGASDERAQAGRLLASANLGQTLAAQGLRRHAAPLRARTSQGSRVCGAAPAARTCRTIDHALAIEGLAGKITVRETTASKVTAVAVIFSGSIEI